MSTILKFKTYENCVFGEKAKFMKLDGTAYSIDKTQELIFTNVGLDINFGDMVDKQNFEKVKRNLIMVIQSVEMQDFIDAFNIDNALSKQVKGRTQLCVKTLQLINF